MTFNINIGQTIVVDASPEDAGGNPGLLISGAVPLWVASPAAGIQITPATDGLSAQVSATVPGTYAVTVTANNSNNGGISGSFTVTVSEQPATQIVFSLG